MLETENTTSFEGGGTLLITGGTGSFGNAVLERFLKSEIDEIRILSRDEKNKMICVNTSLAIS